MDERTSVDRPDAAPPPVGADAPTEAVRILRPGEATGGGAGSRRAEGLPRYGDRPDSPPAGGARPALRFPLTSGDDGADLARPRVTGAPTAVREGDLDTWSGSGGSRWRGAAAGDEGDPGERPGADDVTHIASLHERDAHAADQLFAFDSDDDDHEDTRAVEAVDDPGPDPGDGYEDDEGALVDDGDEGSQPDCRSRPRPPAARSGARSSRAAQPGTDRNLPLAIGVGVGLAVAAIVAMTIGPGFGVAFATMIVTLCAAELFGALRKAGRQPATLLGLVATAALVTAAYWKGEPALPLVLTLTVVFTLLWYLVGVSRASPTVNAAVTILTVAYVGLFGSFAALMLRLPNGTGILLGTLLAVVANDVGALFAGRRFGRRPMAAAISPNKTIEGALGGALASIVVSYLVLDLIGLHPWEAKAGSALALGLLVAVLAPVGDLVESMLKRDLAVKDMGSILPGHGGLIDRFDAILFVLPAAYYLSRLLEIA